MKIEIWSDYACPFCYIGKEKLDLALKELELESSVEKSFKSFQLNINAVSHPNEDMNSLIANKYGISYEKAKEANDNIVNVAEEVGLQFDFDTIKPGNTGLAHEVYKYAESVGKAQDMAKRLFAAYFEEGKDISNEKELLKLAEEVGISKKDLMIILKDRIHRDAVVNDQDMARKHNINSVPFFVINDEYTVSGAQSVEYFKMVLDKVSNV